MQSRWKLQNNVSLNSTQYLNLRILLMFNKQLQKVFFSNHLFPVTSKFFFNVTLTDREPKQRLDMVHGSVIVPPASPQLNTNRHGHNRFKQQNKNATKAECHKIDLSFGPHQNNHISSSIKGENKPSRLSFKCPQWLSKPEARVTVNSFRCESWFLLYVPFLCLCSNLNSDFIKTML